MPPMASSQQELSLPSSYIWVGLRSRSVKLLMYSSVPMMSRLVPFGHQVAPKRASFAFFLRCHDGKENFLTVKDLAVLLNLKASWIYDRTTPHGPDLIARRSRSPVNKSTAWFHKILAPFRCDPATSSSWYERRWQIRV